MKKQANKLKNYYIRFTMLRILNPEWLRVPDIKSLDVSAIMSYTGGKSFLDSNTLSKQISQLATLANKLLLIIDT